MSKIVITGSGENFHFNLKAGNGESILHSESYTTRTAATNGAESVIANSSIEARYEHKESTNGKYFFVLKASNGQIIGNSEMYESENGCENGAQSVMRNGPVAEIVDETV